MGKGWKSFDVHVGKNLDCFKGTVFRKIKMAAYTYSLYIYMHLVIPESSSFVFIDGTKW